MSLIFQAVFFGWKSHFVGQNWSGGTIPNFLTAFTWSLYAGPVFYGPDVFLG